MVKEIQLCKLHSGDIFRYTLSDGTLSEPCKVIHPFFTDNICSFITCETLFDSYEDFIFNKLYVVLLFTNNTALTIL